MNEIKRKKLLKIYFKKLQRYTNRKWYPPLLGLLSLLDNLIIIIPNDGLLISSTMIVPKKWFTLALNVAIGSTMGALVLASIVEYQGLPWILEHYPSLSQNKQWLMSQEFFESYGLLFVFFIGLSPLMQQPAIIFAGLANTPLLKLALVVFSGRFIKFLIMAYLASHSPKYLKKLWGLKDELEEVNVKPPE